jgi:hypothetical protein
MSSTPQTTRPDGIRLERISEFRTRVTYGTLDATTNRALRLLRRASVGSRCNWATEEEWEAVQTTSGELGLQQKRSLVLRGAIAAIARFLRRQLQPERSLLTEVRFSDGTICDCYEASYDAREDAEETPKPPSTWRPLIE